MKMFTRIFTRMNTNKEIDMRIFFNNRDNNTEALPPFTKNYYFSYVKRDF